MLLTKKTALSIFCCGILAACASVQETPSSTLAKTETATVQPATKLQADASQAAEDKMVCKRTPVTGSRFKKKVCMTQEQWDSMRDDAKSATGEFQRKNTGVGAPGG